MKARKAFLILAAVAAAGSTVYADKVSISQAPPAVQQAIRSKAGRHQIEDIDRETRNGQVTYEASWKDTGGAQQELLVSEAGTILRDVVGPSTGLANQNLTLANKTGVGLTETPQAVQNAIHNQIPNAPIDSVQKGIWNGQNVYEVTFHDNGQLKTYQVTETGQPVVSGRPAISFQPRYAGVADANVALSAGSKMAFNEAPRNVQRTVTHMANGARIEDFERGQWNGRTVYQAAFKRNGEHVELQVFDDGTILTKAPATASASATTTPAATSASSTAKTPTTGAAYGGSFPGFGGNNPSNSRPSTTTTTPPASVGSAPRYAGLAESNVQLSGGSKMSFAAAPRPVQTTVNQVANGARVEDFERGTWNGRTVYEAAFKRNGQNIELQVLDDGTILTKDPATAAGAPAAGVSGGVQP